MSHKCVIPTSHGLKKSSIERDEDCRAFPRLTETADPFPAYEY